MRNVIFMVFTITLFSPLTFVNGQNTVDDVISIFKKKKKAKEKSKSSNKEENTEIINFGTTNLGGEVVEYDFPLEGYEFNILRCEGNKSTQIVTITFMLKHQMVHQRIVSPRKGKMAYTEEGDQISNVQLKVGTNKKNAILHTDAPVKCTISIRNMLPRFKKLYKVIVPVVSYNADGKKNKQQGDLMIKNIPIDWK